MPEIVELDLNPVIALPPGNGCRIVDARVRVATKNTSIVESPSAELVAAAT